MTQFSPYQKAMSDRFTQLPHETLMVMLYEGMITKIKQARERFEADQKIKAKEALMRAMRIADALMDNLNFEQGGETAQSLEKLYYYVISELATANREEEPETHLKNAEQILETLLESWKELETKAKAP